MARFWKRRYLYEYQPEIAHVANLAKISSRHNQTSITSIRSQNRSRSFHDALERRDTKCVASGNALTPVLVATHLVPKRLGDVNTTEIFHSYVGDTLPASTPIDRFHPALGIYLCANIKSFVDRYLLGFWSVPGSVCFH